MKRYKKNAKKINYLKIYKVNISKMMNVRNPNAMYKARPGIVLPFTPQKIYYGTTGYIIIPLSGSYNKKLKRYTVELKTINKKGKSSYALVYNFGTTTYENLKLWIYESGEEIQITEEELETVANMYLKLTEEGVRMTLADLQRKPYTETMLEKLEQSSEQLQKRMKVLESNSILLKEENKELKKGNEELKEMIKKLIDNDKKS